MKRPVVRRFGAPASMKMGTVASPWRYDAVFDFALVHATAGVVVPTLGPRPLRHALRASLRTGIGLEPQHIVLVLLVHDVFRSVRILIVIASRVSGVAIQ